MQYNFLSTQSLIHSQPPSSNHGIQNMQILQISQFLQNSWKKNKPNSQKSSISPQKRIWNKIMEKRIPDPRPTPITKLCMTSMVWNIFMGQLGLAGWLCSLPAPAHLLIS